MVVIGNDWDEVLKEEFEKQYYRELKDFLKEEYADHTVYPDMHDIFNALKYTSYEDVKVVILGQDPYHEPGQAHGMAFSVKKSVQQPASLKNIFKELHDDIGVDIPPSNNGCLVPWAERGVLLLNTVLTVRAHEANSHKGKGWENFTDAVISKLSSRERPIVFILWGRNAKSKEQLIDQDRHLVITGAHPSPLSAYNGFFGGRYFSRANRFLEACGEEPIDWDITD